MYIYREMPSRGKHFAFTSFDMETLPESRFKHFTYLVYQKEQCPKTGKFHFQGCVSFKSQRTLPAVIKEWTGPHYELVRNLAKARNYCRKNESRATDGGPYEFTEKVELNTDPRYDKYKEDLKTELSRYFNGSQLESSVDMLALCYDGWLYNYHNDEWKVRHP